MTGEMQILHDAREVVAAEQTAVRREIAVFTEFRDAVSHIYPAQDDDGRTEQTKDIVETYEETVLSVSDFGMTTERALESSLAVEFSESLADTLLSHEPYTNRLKRKLLVRTSTVIDRRTSLQEDLEREVESLETATAVLSYVATSAGELPVCTVRNSCLEELLDTWEKYDELEARCGRLLSNRQRELAVSSRLDSAYDEEHALCQYLYADLYTTYPVLSAVANVCKQIRVS